MAFKDILTDKQRKELHECQETHMQRLAIGQQMTDLELADAAEYAMRNMFEPRLHSPGRPTYNSSFYHVYVPEMVKRLRRKEQS